MPSRGRRQKDQQSKIREMEKKLESVLRDFEYHAREAVNAIQERAAAQKLSKDAERRIAKLRREFREQFDSTVVAHATGADKGDPHAQPQVVKHVSEGDTVKLKSTGPYGQSCAQARRQHFEVEVGRDEDEDRARRHRRSAERRRGFSGEGRPRARDFRVARARRRRTRPAEINVIGQTVDEATRAVEKFVDRAFLAGLAARARRPRQRHGHPAQGAAPVRCSSIPTSRQSPSLRRTKAAAARRWWSCESRRDMRPICVTR